MNKEQIKTLQTAGFYVGVTPTQEQPKMTFWRKERNLGGDGKVVEGTGWVEMPNLPADSDSIKRYLQRGFVPVKPIEVETKDSTCSICGRVCNGEFGLTSHMKAHKNETNKEGK